MALESPNYRKPELITNKPTFTGKDYEEYTGRTFRQREETREKLDQWRRNNSSEAVH